jgi:hypothetical protein
MVAVVAQRLEGVNSGQGFSECAIRKFICAFLDSATRSQRTLK